MPPPPVRWPGRTSHRPPAVPGAGERCLQLSHRFARGADAQAGCGQRHGAARPQVSGRQARVVAVLGIGGAVVASREGSPVQRHQVPRQAVGAAEADEGLQVPPLAFRHGRHIGLDAGEAGYLVIAAQDLEQPPGGAAQRASVVQRHSRLQAACQPSRAAAGSAAALSCRSGLLSGPTLIIAVRSLADRRSNQIFQPCGYGPRSADCGYWLPSNL